MKREGRDGVTQRRDLSAASQLAAQGIIALLGAGDSALRHRGSAGGPAPMRTVPRIELVPMEPTQEGVPR
jgi:hypothetical protein